MNVEERIEQITNKEIAEALVQIDGGKRTASRVIEAYGFDWTKTTTEEDYEIFDDFVGRYVSLVAMYRLSEIAEMQQREKAVKSQLMLGVASDIIIWLAYAKRTPEITTESVASLAEKIVERVYNA